jgi:hypothetical protein
MLAPTKSFALGRRTEITSPKFESQEVIGLDSSDSTVMALVRDVSRAMMERYSHIRTEAKRSAVDDLSGIEFAPVGTNT